MRKPTFESLGIFVAWPFIVLLMVLAWPLALLMHVEKSESGERTIKLKWGK